MGWVKISVDETCHVVWRVRRGSEDIYLHAIGTGSARTVVTGDLAKMRFDGGRCISPWLPVLFPARAITPGRRSINCVTAAATAIVRGWFYAGQRPTDGGRG
jgi:hypothetical protein